MLILNCLQMYDFEQFMCVSFVMLGEILVANTLATVPIAALIQIQTRAFVSLF